MPLPADAGLSAGEAALQEQLWRRTRRLTGALLLVWLATSLAVPWFARTLSGITVAGFSLGYWLAAEVALLAFLAVIVVHAVVMDRLEANYRTAVAAAVDAAQPAAAAQLGADADADAASRLAAQAAGQAARR